MGSIYDKKNNIDILSSNYSDKTATVGIPKQEIIAEKNELLAVQEEQIAPTSTQYAELDNLQTKCFNALGLVDDVVMKNYVTTLSGLRVAENENKLDTSDVVLFKINKMVYEKDEFATEKFVSVVSSMTFTSSSIFLVIDGKGEKTDFYLGIKCEDAERNAGSVAEALKSSMVGQFPGIQLEDLSVVGKGETHSKQDVLIDRLTSANSISSYIGVPAVRNNKKEYTNESFVQGIEKFANAMRGKTYTAVILAKNVPQSEINNIRAGYENVYTEISAMSTQQMAYSTNESFANALSRTKGYSDSTSSSDTKGSSVSNTTGTSHTDGKSSSHTHSTSVSNTEGESKENFWGKASKLAGPLLTAGAILGGPIGIGLMAGGAVAGVGGIAGTKQLSKSTTKSESDSDTEGTSSSDTVSNSKTLSTNQSHTDGTSHSESFSETDGTTSTIGTSKNFTVTVQNKHIQNVLKRIDKQLERLDMCESSGIWSASAYFLSYGTDRASAEIGASIFRSIMQGEQSGVETSAINTWYSGNGDFECLNNQIASFKHPSFWYDNPNVGTQIQVLPTSLVSSKELAMTLSLPRKSVPGFPVVEHISLAKEVVKLDKNPDRPTFKLGNIFDQGEVHKDNEVRLDVKSLTQHTFVTGSTGCGKSETIYKLIDCVRNANAKFMIIEPAKGEYKNVFGDETVYGTNPLISDLLKINPFRFAKGVHVLEHADRLIEIFNVCWPMYAAMPAVLKEAVLNAYEDCGWNLITSTNKYSESIFPTFTDLIWELETVIETSSYSDEVKSNYKGSLVTRVKSLANGINGEIFSGQEIGDEKLFDENVIVDLSRIGSQETKSLIMGILIMRLNEYRSNSSIEANSSLRHVTILEEAHNILKRCSQEQSMEGSNVAGKSVEMISNAIAEMRTYGEGFIIVDQSPGAVDISAIRNTNTKIIMRLPEDSDRKIAGKSAAMKDNQVDEIAKLPVGVAVIYQNDWEEPVLCKIQQFDAETNGNKLADKRKKYVFKEKVDNNIEQSKVIIEAVKFMMTEKAAKPEAFDIVFLKENLASTSFPTYVKLNIFAAIQEYEETGTASIWKNNEYEKFSWIISGIFDSKQEVIKLAKQAKDFDSLTEGLKRIIKNKVETIPSELELSICQSLMRDYSIGDENRLKIYNAWLQKTKSKIM